ncbi:hypothetical protein Q4E93_20990 [Flavitalea sp. BT771]|uniref:hypothetical protein n=1 Tax=Flavitalea sp. BT771 TaxID=3063329 RepID=UPI0026E1C6DE|nr:hypothetical protein [Flavitalea sp. BT771]MDO6433098.1 hypothetical protein [Flavitalea sp. BT771]MDV6221626.1 hypothetical protein [Flavitalea sp. BT771]
MRELSQEELEYRKQLARQLLSAGNALPDSEGAIGGTFLPEEFVIAAASPIPFPGGLTPVPQPINPVPGSDAKLPKADIVIVTWTVDEQDGLAMVMTPKHSSAAWYKYDRFFKEKYAMQTRKGSPASHSQRLGSYFMTSIKDKKVLCFKSELHLNQDGIKNFNGTQTSLPVRDMFKQIIEETNCTHIFSVGTGGGIELEHDLGDVLVTRAALFHCKQEFANASFNNKTYKSDWNIPITYFDEAEKLMNIYVDKLDDPATFGPPTLRHTGTNWQLKRKFAPNIIHEKASAANAKLRPFQPILTTDYFEYGNSNNAQELWKIGCGVEMGDAVLGLVCQDDVTDPPKWLIIRNVSDPQINGTFVADTGKKNMQTHWAVWYYSCYGKWTSVMSSFAAWAVIAGL